MTEDLFKTSIVNAQNKLKFHKKLSVIIRFFSLGIFSNQKKFRYYEAKLESCNIDYRRYLDLLDKASELDKVLETSKINGVRIGKHTFSDISVVGGADYGADWEVLRIEILSRDNYECQKSDGYCSGPLQIHHIIPLSKGGTNSNTNLITLCYHHHSLKHKHMRK